MYGAVIVIVIDLNSDESRGVRILDTTDTMTHCILSIKFEPRLVPLVHQLVH
jgi:nicotinamide riboside kinase